MRDKHREEEERDVAAFGEARACASEFLRCAHTAAWICHDTTARRGNVGRRSTAEIVEPSPAAFSPERALPSQGHNHNQLQVVFGALDQPAILYGLSNLPRVVGFEDPISPDDEDAAAGIALRTMPPTSSTPPPTTPSRRLT